MSRKQCKRVRRIATVSPLVFKLEASAAASGKVLAWRTSLAGMMNLIKSGNFGHDDANRLHEYISTCVVIAKMSKRQDVYDYVGEAAECFINMLQRRRSIDRWVATGDEIKTLAVRLDAMAEAIGELPETTIKMAMVRAEIEMQQVRAVMVKRGEIAA